MKTLKDYEYYRTDLGVLYCGCSIKLSRKIKEYFDLLYTDPVWPNSMPELYGSKNPYKLFKKCIKKYKRKVNRYAIHLGIDSDPRFLKAIPKKIKFLRSVWLRYAFPHPKGRILYSGDICYLYGKAQIRVSSGRKVIPGEKTSTDNKGNKTGHPCSRKLEHTEYIISIFSNKDELIFDPFTGSGTTAVACEKLGRRWIGIEISEKYCKIAKQRIKNEADQFKMEMK